MLQRTYRIWDGLKLNVVYLLLRDLFVVGRHGDCGEGRRRWRVEGSPEQILEVVAIMIKALSRVHPFD